MPERVSAGAGHRGTWQAAAIACGPAPAHDAASPAAHPAGIPAPPASRRGAGGALVGQLPQGTRCYLCADRLLGILSLPGVSVWSNARVLWWRTADGEMTWPAADAPGAARRLAELSGSA